VFDPALQIADHKRPVDYEMPMPPKPDQRAKGQTLYVLKPRGRASRATDTATEKFVDETRMSATP